MSFAAALTKKGIASVEAMTVQSERGSAQHVKHFCPTPHASRPHLTIDPAVVTVGTIHAGEAVNVIPGYAQIALSVCCFDPAVRDLLQKRIVKLTNSVVDGFDAKADIDYELGYPVVVNSEFETNFARHIAEELLGPEKVATSHLSPGSEDFAYSLGHKPGSFLRLGNGVKSAALHNSRYDFADDSLTTAGAMWARLAERYLQVTGI